MSDDPYVDPDTGVLINLLGLTDADELSVVETDIVIARIHQLRSRRIPGVYDVAHLQAFHRHLFGDVYVWAGDFRTVNIARTAAFGDWRFARPYLDQVFADLAAENHLEGIDAEVLVGRLAHYIGEVNAAHPFREGNGRTQRAFFKQLAHDAGWSLGWSATTADENASASEASLMGDQKPLERLLRKTIEPIHGT